MKQFVCIHSHFYQPPRENPWLQIIESQESAYPFHDWNARINAECYKENAQSFLIGENGKIDGIVNNYSLMNFNFGPSLLSWMEKHDPNTYSLIIEGDQLGAKRFNGHGTAIAQCYNHIIMPLANFRDKETQINWGLKDFERRFGRQPESMWLPETAVDIESLEILSDYGMKYIILAPRQAQKIRPLNSDTDWIDVSHEKIDPRRPYLINLPSGRSIIGFFYDGGISKDVAFQGLLHNGETFANRLINSFSADLSEVQISHIATDGETYGHHHRHGDMALAYALKYIENHPEVALTNYGEFIEQNPPQYEAMIFEKSSWSCVHGVSRWTDDCGCNSGMKPGWRQKWRRPLREGYDFLRNSMQDQFVKSMERRNIDPWKLRNDYIDIIFDRSEAKTIEFINKWSPETQSPEQINSFIKELEVQHQLQLMYTSCAWFFDEISGIETTQTLQYACRALELYTDLYPENSLENEFLSLIEKAPSNIPDLKNGRYIYENLVQPVKVNFSSMAVHIAIANLFEEFPEDFSIYSFDVQIQKSHKFKIGRHKIAIGVARLYSQVTHSIKNITFAAIRFEDHNLNAGVRFFQSEDNYQSLLQQFNEIHQNADLPAAIRVLDKEFGPELYTLKDLIRDYRYKVIDELTKGHMSSIEGQLSSIYKQNYGIMSHLSNLKVPLPKVLQYIGSFVKHKNLLDALAGDLTSEKRETIEAILSDTKRWGIDLNYNNIGDSLVLAINDRISRLIQNSLSEKLFENLTEDVLFLLEVGQQLEFDLDLKTGQTKFFNWVNLDGVLAFSNDGPKRDKLLKIADHLKVSLP
jgi:alpha-amylase/alpha-mannosidase (GH57 family)